MSNFHGVEPIVGHRLFSWLGRCVRLFAPKKRVHKINPLDAAALSEAQMRDLGLWEEPRLRKAHLEPVEMQAARSLFMRRPL